MLEIIINNTPIQLGSSIPSVITQLSIICAPFTQIPAQQVPLVQQWIEAIIANINCEFITYNNVLIPTSDFKPER